MLALAYSNVSTKQKMVYAFMAVFPLNKNKRLHRGGVLHVYQSFLDSRLHKPELEK
jgi:hypothetical protein